MTLNEASELTLEPVRDIFNKAIDNLENPDVFNSYFDLIKYKDIDERINAKVAFYALDPQNQPDHKAYENALKNITNNHKGNINELMTYRNNIKAIIHYVEELSLQIYGWKYLSEMFLSSTDNSNKRWDKEDDDELIEMACKGIPEICMSVILKRSPSSIKTRISYLVGVKRLSQKVAGKFIGEINGEQTEAELIGTIYKR